MFCILILKVPFSWWYKIMMAMARMEVEGFHSDSWTKRITIDTIWFDDVSLIRFFCFVWCLSTTISCWGALYITRLTMNQATQIIYVTMTFYLLWYSFATKTSVFLALSIRLACKSYLNLRYGNMSIQVSFLSSIHQEFKIFQGKFRRYFKFTSINK